MPQFWDRRLCLVSKKRYVRECKGEAHHPFGNVLLSVVPEIKSICMFSEIRYLRSSILFLMELMFKCPIMILLEFLSSIF